MKTCARCGEESPEPARFCMACGAELIATRPSRQVRKTISVVFSDLVGSTEVGERTDPEALRELLATYFTEMRSVIERHGGRVERLLGDAVIAVFGLPVAAEDDALRAVRAAVEMQAALADVNDRLPKGLDVAIEARTGVNTGEVLVADDALTGLVSGDIVGDTVNVAARLETTAAPGEILLGDLTHRLVRDYTQTEQLHLSLKGKRESVQAHRLVSLSKSPALGRRLVAPLVGRDTENSELISEFEDTRASNATRLITVLGAAGSGKSRLVRDVTAGLRQKATVVMGRCLPYGEATLMPVAEIVTQLLGIELEADSARAQDALMRLLASEPDDVVRARAARIAGLLGLGPLAGAAEDAIPDLAALLGAIAARQGPIIAVVEDLHWANDSLLDLLANLVAATPRAPILMICTARPELLENRPDWSPTMTLEPLDERHARELVAALLGDGQGLARLAETVLAVAEGNPLVVEEALAMLIDDGVLVRRAGEWELVREIDNIQIPPTVDAILSARLDRLPDREREVLELAAIVGKQFTRLELAALDAGSGDDLEHIVDALWAKQLIDVDEQGSAGWRFHHILVRDASYSATPKRRRAQLHNRYADIVENSPGGERGGQFGAIVGEHLERSYRLQRELGASADDVRELGLRAAHRLADAGERATGMSDHATAERLQLRALDLIDHEHVLRASLLVDLADVRFDLGLLAEVQEDLVHAVDLAEGIGARETHLRAALSLMRIKVVTRQRDADGAIEEMRRNAGQLEGMSDDRTVVRAWMAISHVAYFANHHALGFEMAQRALGHARRLGGAELPYCLVGMCEFALRGPMPASEVQAECEAAMEAAQPGTLHAAFIEMKLGTSEALQGRFESARDRITHAMAVCEAHNAVLWIADAEYKLGKCAILAGDVAGAERNFARSRELLVPLNDPFYAVAIGLHALCLTRLGQHEAARAAAQMAQEETLDVESEIVWRMATAETLCAFGEYAEATTLAREAVALAEAGDDLFATGDALHSLGMVLQAQGLHVEARTAIEGSIAAYEQKGVAPAIAAAHDLLRASAR